MPMHLNSKLTMIESTQVDRIVSKFGGWKALWKALVTAGFERDLTALYRWSYPKEKGGAGGVVPTHSMHQVLEAARLEGVHLTTEDLDPRVSLKRKYEVDDE